MAIEAGPRPGESRLFIDTEHSRAVILVRRAGPLARFGHDHAILARPAEGVVYWADGEAPAFRASLAVDVAALEVDPPDVRAEFALDTQPDADDISATRANMLRHVFDAEQWPQVEMTIRSGGHGAQSAAAEAELIINGRTGRVAFPMVIQSHADRLEASGNFELNQRDWGLEPFSVLGGGLRVADPVEIHFRVTAVREADGTH